MWKSEVNQVLWMMKFIVHMTFNLLKNNRELQNTTRRLFNQDSLSAILKKIKNYWFKALIFILKINWFKSQCDLNQLTLAEICWWNVCFLFLLMYVPFSFSVWCIFQRVWWFFIFFKDKVISTSKMDPSLISIQSTQKLITLSFFFYLLSFITSSTCIFNNDNKIGCCNGHIIT